MRDLAFLTGADIARRAEPFADEQQFLAGVTELVDVLCLLFSQINHNDEHGRGGGNAALWQAWRKAWPE